MYISRDLWKIAEGVSFVGFRVMCTYENNQSLVQLVLTVSMCYLVTL